MIRLLPGFFLLTMFATALPVHAEDLILAAGGKTTYAIVIDPSAVLPPDAEGNPRISPTQHAANELAAILQQVTGAQFNILVTAELPRGMVLVVGRGGVQQLLAPDLKLDELKPDGIVIETSGLNLILAGDEPRGTLYAVYTFLEDVVGCRWWSSKASTIPSKPDLTVPEQHVRYVPPLEYRETFWFDAFDGDFAVRNKSNANRAQLDEQRGGKIRYGGPFFVHTFDLLMPPKEFAAEHPEYYSERDGKRIVADIPYCQLCVTNPDVKRIVTERVLAYLAKDPTASIISVSQNDADQHCLCAECTKLEEYEGSPAGPLLHLVNYVAAEVAKQYPNVAIDTLAYQYTRKRCRTSSCACAASSATSPPRSPARLTRPSPTTSAAGTRSATACTSGTTPPTSATTSCPFRTSACSGPMCASSWAMGSRACSSRAPTSPTAPRWPS
jgi:hypothetical protein